MKLSSKKVHEKFWKDKLIEEQKYKEYGPVSRHIRNIMFTILNDLKFKSLLDAGCGQSTVLAKIKERYPKVKYTGLDISELAIQTSRKILPDINFYVMDISEKKLNKKFDVTIMLDVFEHVENDMKAMKNAASMTEKYLLLSTLLGRMRDGEEGAGHVRNYTLEELEGKLEKNNFRVIKVVKWGFPFYSPIFRDINEFFDKLQKRNKKITFKKDVIEKWPWYTNIIAWTFYSAMKLNFSNRGDFVFILAKKIHRVTN